MNLDRLSIRVRGVGLFSALGEKIQDSSVIRLRSWEEWPGPEEPRVEAIGTHMQFLHDQIISADAEPEWNRALRITVDFAAALVPYVEEQDAWYAPNIAVWSAAWIFALEEAHVARNLPLPAEVRAQLYWYQIGHWPSSLVSLSRYESIEDYVVY